MNDKQITIVTAIIQNEKGEFLISRRNEPSLPHAHNKWQFIGGGIEYGEDPEHAIVREVKEEAGIVVEVTGLMPKVMSHVWDITAHESHVLILSYICKIISGTPTANLDEETGELGYFSFELIKQLDTLPNTVQVFEYFLGSSTAQL